MRVGTTRYARSAVSPDGESSSRLSNGQDLAARNLLPCLTDVRTCPDARPFVPLHSSPGRAGGTPPGEDPAHLQDVAGWLAGLPDPASPLVCYGFSSLQRVMRPLDAAQAQHHAAVA